MGRDGKIDQLKASLVPMNILRFMVLSTVTHSFHFPKLHLSDTYLLGGNAPLSTSSAG